MINLEDRLDDLYSNDLQVIKEYLEDGQYDIDAMCNDYSEPSIYYDDRWQWLLKEIGRNLGNVDNLMVEVLSQGTPDAFFDLIADMQAIEKNRYFYKNRDEKLEYIATWYLVKELGVRYVEQDELEAYIDAVIRDDGLGDDLSDWNECFRAHITTAGYADLDEEMEE